MRKIKIYTTIFVLYEFAIITILQIPNYCIYFFNIDFCVVPFRYFLMCVIVPVSFGLLVWWMPEISRLFCKKCQCEVQEDMSIKDVLKEIVTKQDIERLITAAIVMGIQKFATNHPKAKEAFDGILNALEQNNANSKSRLTK